MVRSRQECLAGIGFEGFIRLDGASADDEGFRRGVGESKEDTDRLDDSAKVMLDVYACSGHVSHEFLRAHGRDDGLELSELFDFDADLGFPIDRHDGTAEELFYTLPERLVVREIYRTLTVGTTDDAGEREFDGFLELAGGELELLARHADLQEPIWRDVVDARFGTDVEGLI